MRDLTRRSELDRAVADVADRVDVVQLDVTDPGSRAAAVETTLARYGRLDILVNNAGISLLGSAEVVDEPTMRALFETNVFGPLALIKLLLPQMRAQGGGRIVNVTSIGALVTPAFYTTYCANKHALDAYTSGLDLELNGSGIRCASVAPGGYRTAILDNGLLAADSTYAKFPGVVDAWKSFAGSNSDLTPVIDAILQAATDTDPAPRYLVGDGMPTLAGKLAAEAEKLHELLRTRV
jgi:NAD(P)-dependent dehydrogenase (short-subunit alcohol dehydrogenase family)